MKLLLTICFWIFIQQALFAQQPAGSWTFISGSYLTPSVPIYKTKGTEYTSVRPSARTNPFYFTDKDGNFWLVGEAQSGYYKNDFWRYRPSTGKWAWMAGDSTTRYIPPKTIFGQYRVPTPGASPVFQESSSYWADSVGNFWLFGGGSTNHLWKYKIADMQWVWMGGDTTNKYSGYLWHQRCS